MESEPARERPGADLSNRMSRLRRSGTAPELALRHELHRRGLRFRVQLKVPGNNRRSIDIAFTRVRLAVFVDGCFWHGCTKHGTRPSTNADWWRWKIQRNTERDRDTDRLLASAGWRVVRIWEHESPHHAADRVQRAYVECAARLP